MKRSNILLAAAVIGLLSLELGTPSVAAADEFNHVVATDGSCAICQAQAALANAAPAATHRPPACATATCDCHRPLALLAGGLICHVRQPFARARSLVFGRCRCR